MARINLRKEPDGWRATIEDRGRTFVVDGYYDEAEEAVEAADSARSRLKL